MLPRMTLDVFHNSHEYSADTFEMQNCSNFLKYMVLTESHIPSSPKESRTPYYTVHEKAMRYIDVIKSGTNE